MRSFLYTARSYPASLRKFQSRSTDFPATSCSASTSAGGDDDAPAVPNSCCRSSTSRAAHRVSSGGVLSPYLEYNQHNMCTSSGCDAELLVHHDSIKNKKTAS